MTGQNKIVFALAATLALTVPAASAEQQDGFIEYGSGDAPRYSEVFGEVFHDLLDDARAPPLAALGDDALRFSSQPGLGGTGYIIVLRSIGSAEISWFEGHGSLGWRRTRRVRFDVPSAEYQRVVAHVDRLLAAGIADADERDGAAQVCADGPGYLTERIQNGEITWLRPPMCSGVNAQIAAHLMSWAFVRLGR